VLSAHVEKLCLACTLCCNGGLFADLKLSRADQARLKRNSIALTLTQAGKLRQPCQALCGPKCTIYASRPDYCRQFECLLLKRVKDGEVRMEVALRVIRSARRRLARVEGILRAMGCEDSGRAVSVRFRQLAQRVATTPQEAAQVALFGDLTLAMHNLNHYLARHFYPG